MAVLKYKNSNGEYVAIPTGIPSAVSAFDNDADYQNAEQVEVRIDEKMIRPAEWSGMWRDGSEFGVNVADGLEITPDNHLRTESWLIPHNDGSVGDAIENMRMEIQGVRFVDFLTCENIGWIDNTIIGDCLPNNDEMWVEEMLNRPDLEININIQGEEFGRGFSVWAEKQGDTFIGYFPPEDWGDEWDFERFELDAVNHKARLYCKPECWFVNQPIHRFNLEIVEVSRPVKQIRTREGLWQNTMNGGERVEIGVNAGYGLRFNDGMLEADENQLFNNDNSAYPAKGEIGGNLDISPIQWGLDTEDWASDWVSHAVEDKPRLHLRFEVERNGEYFGFAGNTHPEPIQNGTANNGSQFDWLWDMTGALGEDVNAEVGIEKIEVGYSANDNQFFIVVSLGDTTKGYSLQYVRFGVRDKNPTLAHYCIGDWGKWETYERNGMLVADVSERYIIDLIDSRLNDIPVAEQEVF